MEPQCAEYWFRTGRADRRAASIADRHYPRRRRGCGRLGGPARTLVLVTEEYNALWIASWPKPEYILHPWKESWTCSCFRNESAALSSTMILAALSVTRHFWGDPPADGMITFVDPGKVRHKRDPGRCFLRAGFSNIGKTQTGLIVLQCLPAAIPLPLPPRERQASLFDGAPFTLPKAPSGSPL
jgi:hypothetical protein